MSSTSLCVILFALGICESLVNVQVIGANVTDIKYYDPNYGKTWMILPDSNGFPHIIDLNKKQLSTKLFHNYLQPDNNIIMWLYNKQHKTVPKLLKVTGSTNARNFTLDKSFNETLKTKILIHGWKHDYKSSAVQLMKNAYLEGPNDMNVIAVDWAEIAGDRLYMLSALSTRTVGQNIAYVIDHMVNKHNVSLSDVHVIGHSLGAHAAGHTGMYVKSFQGKKVARITGLDPANPTFEDTTKLSDILDPSDAEFVDVIHSCAGIVGHTGNLGHADFWPNSGKPSQPGCDVVSDFFGSCSHAKSFRYFTESIKESNEFPALKCNSWESFLANKCKNGSVSMGEATPSSARGSYYLRTSLGPSFAKVKNKIKTN